MKILIKKDAHVHTPFCPHGTKDDFVLYIEKAIKMGFHEISFTEHAPFPNEFIDPTPKQDSAMDFHKLEEYIYILKTLKKEFEKDIKINIGLEVDFLIGYESKTTELLNQYGHEFDDSILSVHFLKVGEKYYCLDFDHHTFQHLVQLKEGVSNVYELYYQTVYQAVLSDLGPYKPKRIGHLTLIRKFQKLFPENNRYMKWIEQILTEMAKRQMELDVNVAGLRKEYCGEIYPPKYVINIAIQQKIPLVYGSDAHSAKDVGANYMEFEQILL